MVTTSASAVSMTTGVEACGVKRGKLPSKGVSRIIGPSSSCGDVVSAGGSLRNDGRERGAEGDTEGEPNQEGDPNQTDGDPRREHGEYRGA
jgi:hypothetical protein